MTAFWAVLLAAIATSMVGQTLLNAGAGAADFMAQLFAWILPPLELFNAGPSIATGAVIPWAGYVLPALGCCVLYSGAALFFAFLLFEDRDLA